MFMLMGSRSDIRVDVFTGLSVSLQSGQPSTRLVNGKIQGSTVMFIKFLFCRKKSDNARHE